MCGRYSLNLKDNHSSFKRETINNFKSIFDYKNEDICPTNKAPIVFNLNSKFVFKQSSWGLSFDWLPKGKTLFNIRSETVHEKSFSNSLIANNRCLVPFSSYFEWLKTQELKEKYKLFTKTPVSFFAGVYKLIEDTVYYSILTKSSLENIEFIHNRNPVIINKNNVRKWFSDSYEELLRSSDVIIMSYRNSYFLNLKKDKSFSIPEKCSSSLE